MPLHLERAIELDHLVVACATLVQGDAWLRELAGVPSAPGGSHSGWGTHNRVLRLDAGTYLELIAPDPAQPEPALPRPFGLDDPALRERVAVRPRLVHYVCRVPALDAIADLDLGYDAGPIMAMTRGALSWRITMPQDPASAARRWTDAGRLQPTLIEWPAARRPSGIRPRRSLLPAWRWPGCGCACRPASCCRPRCARTREWSASTLRTRRWARSCRRRAAGG